MFSTQKGAQKQGPMPASDNAMRSAGNFFHIGAYNQSAAANEVAIGSELIQAPTGSSSVVCGGGAPVPM